MEDGRHTPHASNGEGRIGRMLEQTRKDRGLTLEEAERATKIRKRYLVGLERDDYTVLPDAVYARGFLKTYANYLGLDGAGLSRGLIPRNKPSLERSTKPPKSEFGRPIMSQRRVSGTGRRKFPSSTAFTLVAAMLVIVALIGSLYFVGLNVQASSGEDSPGEDRPERADEGDAGPGKEEAPERGTGNVEAGQEEGERSVSSEEPLDTLRVGVEVEGEPVWIRVRSDSETVYEEIAPPGFARTFEARREVGIRAGYAGPISVEVNGQDVGPLGDPGEVVDRSFTLKSAS